MDEDLAPVFQTLSNCILRGCSNLALSKTLAHTALTLKICILAHFPDLKAYKDGRDVVLAFDRDMGAALRKFCKKDFDDENICLARAAKIVRIDIF